MSPPILKVMEFPKPLKAERRLEARPVLSFSLSATRECAMIGKTVNQKNHLSGKDDVVGLASFVSTLETNYCKWRKYVLYSGECKRCTMLSMIIHQG